MEKVRKRARRKQSIRKKISGTSDRPRMCVHRSNKNIYVQVIDDVEGKTICGLSSAKKESKTCKNTKFASEIGGNIAKIALEKGVKKVVFDRAGYLYHGVVKAIAEAARKGGLEF